MLIAVPGKPLFIVSKIRAKLQTDVLPDRLSSFRTTLGSETEKGSQTDGLGSTRFTSFTSSSKALPERKTIPTTTVPDKTGFRFRGSALLNITIQGRFYNVLYTSAIYIRIFVSFNDLPIPSSIPIQALPKPARTFFTLF